MLNNLLLGLAKTTMLSFYKNGNNMKTKILYKSFPENREPNRFKFTLGVWHKHDGELEICNSGFHASKNIIDAMSFVNAFWVAKVEVRGKHIIQDNKECWEEMRVVEWVKWTKKDSISLAIYVAELVLGNFEKQYPNDMRPREAIEAAKNVLKKDNGENRSAAESAWSAVRSAAWSAESAARSAWFAARSAANEKILTKCHNFVIERKGL